MRANIKTFWRRGSTCLLALIVLLALIPAQLAALAAPESITVGILTTTDMHGRIYNIDPLTGSTVNNSFLKVATIVKTQRAALDETIVIDNGDLIQGTAMSSYNVNIEGGENNPLATCLRYIGYDVFVPGNHEFNYSLDIQKRFYDMLKAPAGGDLPGAPVNVAAANILNAMTEEVADPFTPYVIKEYTVGEKTFRIGILGFTNMNVPNWDPASHYEGMKFAHADNTQQYYAYEWTNYWQNQLRNVEKCDIVIVSAHSGLGSSRESQVTHFISNTTGIDMVISGHSHSASVSNLTNRDGQTVRHVNAGGGNVSRSTVTLNSDGTFAFGASSQLSLSASVANDTELQSLMKPYYDRADLFVGEPIGTLSGAWDNVTNYFNRQGDGYDLVHKAQLWAAGADVSISSDVSRGGFRPGSLFAPGADTATINLKNLYQLYQYDNNTLFMAEMTGKQLKSWMERTARNFNTSGSGGGYGHDSFFGVDYEVYVGNPTGSRVQNIMYKGRPLRDDQILKVAVNSYRLSATADNDSYGWFAATGVTSDSDCVLWDACLSEEFGSVGGSVPLIIGEYIKSLTAQGKTIEPGRETRWTVYTSTYTPQTEALALSTDVNLVKSGDYFRVNAGFDTVVASNTAVLDFTFDTDKFAHRGFTPANGVTLLNTENTPTGVKFTVMMSDYNAQALGEILFSARDDRDLLNGDSIIDVACDFVVKGESGDKSIKAAYSYVTITTTSGAPNGKYTLLDLSNLIDWFGVKSGYAEWAQARFYDFNGNGEIDIQDIAYMAQLI